MRIKGLYSIARQNYKLLLQTGLGLMFVLLGIYFIHHEEAELGKVKSSLLSADFHWVLWGMFLLVGFVVVQGMMYQQSFRAIHERISLNTGIVLFLKRNLISVFLPAGMLTNMLFFNESVERKEGVSKTQIYFASSIFAFCSVASAIIMGLPALIWLVVKGNSANEMVLGISLTALLLLIVVYTIVDIFRRGKIFQLLERKSPAYALQIQTFSDQSFDRNKAGRVLGLSILVELIGIAHLYIAITALGGVPTLEMTIIGYAIVLLLLMSSPFLRGIGAVEVALTYALTLFGLSTVLAISVAFLFRFFEFWAVLVLGLIALVGQRDNLLVRLLPVVLLFMLGLINILSGITPALPERLQTLTDMLPLNAIHASVWLVILSGIIMLGIAVYLMKGLRNAWIAAVVLSGVSLLAHLAKGIDWEEATLALITLGSLLYQRKQYFIQPDLRLAKRSLMPGLVAVATVILFGTLGFYYLNPDHFNVDFTLWESLQEAVTTFFLLNIDLTPVTAFGKQFLHGMNLLGGMTLSYLAYLLLRPLVQKPATTAEEDRQEVMALIEKYGKGSLDYFKAYYDKSYWFSEDGEGFVSFKVAAGYAIVLGNPVCADDAAMTKIIPAFDAYCRNNGLRSAYYRIPEKSKSNYEQIGKKLLPIGEEALVNLETWTIEGGDKKAMRNAVNKLTRQGYTFQVNEPPQRDAFLQQLKAVSDSWLEDMGRTEIVFAQGLFDERELKTQVILSLETPEKKVVGFVNLIPDYSGGEATFDLMRKTADAPNGTMDFLFARMFDHLKSMGFKGCNIGMVPMSGIGDPENLQERIIKLAYEKMKYFGHYKSLRVFKEKFNPDWQMMYLVYSAPFDLIYLPNVMEKAVEP